MATEKISELFTTLWTIDSLPLLAFTCGVLPIIYTVCRLIQNAYFHPLSRFPGPILARSTSWWSTYQQVFVRRSMHHICEDLHSIYGTMHLSQPIKRPRLNALQGMLFVLDPTGHDYLFNIIHLAPWDLTTVTAPFQSSLNVRRNLFSEMEQGSVHVRPTGR